MRHVRYQQWPGSTSFSSGEFRGTRVADGALTIDQPVDTVIYADPYAEGSPATYEVATWTSPAVTPEFACTDLVASWNADTPTGTWIQVAAEVCSDGDATGPRNYVLARWANDTAAIHPTSVLDQGDDLASVSTDTIVAAAGRTFSAWRLTVSLHRGAGSSATPALQRVGAMMSGPPTSGPQEVSPSGTAAGRTLDVPPYSQERHVGEYPQYNGGGEAWCSPTSTAMVLGYWQRVTGNPAYGPSTAELAWVDPSYADPQVDSAAVGTFDWGYDGCGNWPFNTAYAGQYGLESFVTRLRSLTEAEQFITAGIPLVASVSFEREELTGAGYGTKGHLLVIVGFTDSGDVVVNDPASHLLPSNDEVRTVYDRAEFESVWLPRSGGTVYVIHPTEQPLPPTLTPEEPNW